MNIKEQKDSFTESLLNYTKEEAHRLFFIFLEEYAGIGRMQYMSRPDALLSPVQISKLTEALGQLNSEVPYQHILGYTYFAGLRLEVAPQALIPRPETEELAYLIKQQIKEKKGLRILDIGTGTGCLALACASFFQSAYVTGWDVSNEALKLAKTNADSLSLNVTFKLKDILEETAWDTNEEWDVIVSNPPYIGEGEKVDMNDVVLNNEPHLALFAPDENVLIFYKAIARYGRRYLKKGGSLFVEINQKLGIETTAVFKEAGFTAELLKDLSGNDRFVIARK